MVVTPETRARFAIRDHINRHLTEFLSRSLTCRPKTLTFDTGNAILDKDSAHLPRSNEGMLSEIFLRESACID